jgi:hypothetical protein
MEHKQYTLLAYIQSVDKAFRQWSLQPHLQSILDISTSMKMFLTKRTDTAKAFRSYLERNKMDDVEGLMRLHGENNTKPETKLILDLLEWTRPLLDDVLEEGERLWEFLKSQFEVSYTGPFPPTKSEGYILFHIKGTDYVMVHSYAMTTISVEDDSRYRGFILRRRDDAKAIFDEDGNVNFDEVRISLNHLLNEYLYVTVTFPVEIPIDETLLPMMKRIVHEKIQADFLRRL